MRDVYVNYIASTVGQETESNSGATFNLPDADVARIAEKTGISSRPISAPHEYTSDLATRSLKDLLNIANLRSSDLNALVVCTQTPDHLIPGVSSKVHGNLSLPSTCSAFDFNQGCSGFIYGLHLLGPMLKSGAAENAVLINADCYSKLIRPSDVTTRALFGDAAAATLLSTERKGLRVIYTRCYANGLGYDDFVAYGSALQPDIENTRGIFMNGPGILNFVLKVVPSAITEALENVGLIKDEVKIFAFHQANEFIIGKLTKKLGLQQNQVPQNCKNLGNTVSASIPILIKENMNALNPGDIVVAVGFGVGLSWGVAVMEYVG